tara:strand:+ start:850 stop:1044 length:195 start_codon:yes stop_codon:yes gene_type:complete
MVQSYLVQLTAQAQRIGINLKDAFVNAGVADSTYYRAQSGSYDLSYSTAAKVTEWLDEQAISTP